MKMRLKHVIILFALISTIIFGADLIKYPIGAATDLAVGTVVKITGDNTVAACGVGEEPAGVIIAVEEYATADSYVVASAGLARNVTVAGAAVSAGDKLVPAAGGAVQPLSMDPDGYIIGIALEGAGIGGNINAMTSIMVSGGGLTQDDVDVPLTSLGDFEFIDGTPDHVHEGLNDLDAAIGALNDNNPSTTPIDFDDISDVPADLSDGDDEGVTSISQGNGMSFSADPITSTGTISADYAGSGGDLGSANTLARSDHLHDSRYYTQSELNTSGAGGQVHWNNLTSVPADISDGDDDTWQANTQAQEGYVAAGGTNYNMVWKTDGSGVPGWRADDETDADADPSNEMQTITAGEGLTGGGSGSSITIDANPDDSSIEVSADQLQVKALGIKDYHIDWGFGSNQVSSGDVPFNPSTPEDWSGDIDPGETDDALDQLANRVDGLESGTGSVTNITGGTGISPDGPTSGAVSLSADMTELTLTGLNAPTATSMSVNYGTTSNTAVEGNETATITAGTGLTGGISADALGNGFSATLNVDFAGTGLASTVARSDHNHSGTYDNYGSWNLQANGGTTTAISSSENVNFAQGGLTTVSRSGNTITISSSGDGTGTDDQNISGSGFDSGTNVLTIGIEDGSNETVDLSALDDDTDADANPTNEIQNVFTQLSDGTNVYTVSGTSDDIQFSSSGLASVAVNPTTGVVTIGASGDGTGTDDQTLTEVLSSGNSAGTYDINMNNNAITNIDWSTSDDGSGSGLDADLLDGQHGSYYLDWDNLTDVPAGFADGVDNVNDADASATNEIQTMTATSVTGGALLDLSDTSTEVELVGSGLATVTRTDANTVTISASGDGTGTDDQTLTEVLSRGNSAGTYDINMNNNDLTNVQNLYIDNIYSDDVTPFMIRDNCEFMAGIHDGSSYGSSGQVLKTDGSGDVYWADDNEGTTISDGTVTNSTLRWNGSSWTENTTVRSQSNRVDIRSDGSEALLYVGDDDGRYIRLRAYTGTGYSQTLRTSNDLYVQAGYGGSASLILRPTYDVDVDPDHDIVLEAGSNALKIQTATGSEYARFDGANQRLGIGTTSPAARLHVAGNGDSDAGDYDRGILANYSDDGTGTGTDYVAIEGDVTPNSDYSFWSGVRGEVHADGPIDVRAGDFRLQGTDTYEGAGADAALYCYVNSSVAGVPSGLLVDFDDSGAGAGIRIEYSGSADPIYSTSTNLCTNVNADLLDGQHGSYYAASADILWNDATSYINPTTATNFRIYDNSSSWMGQWFMSGTDCSTIANLTNTNTYSYICYENSYGLYGRINYSTGYGVYADNDNAAGTGLMAIGNGTSGLYLTSGSGLAATGDSTGGAFFTEAANGEALYFAHEDGTDTTYGYMGTASRALEGYFVESSGNNWAYFADQNYGLYARAEENGEYAGYFYGDVYISGPNDQNNSRLYVYKNNSTTSTEQAIYAAYYNSTDSTEGSAVYGYDGSSSDGEDYDVYGMRSVVKGYAYWGNPYSAGVGGFSYHDYNRSAGVFGGDNSLNTEWGALAYKNSGGTNYGGYFDGGYTGGSGRRRPTPGSSAGMDGEAHIDAGIGSWGDLFGADIHANIYGSYIEGGRYALYTNGDRFTNGADVHLTDVGEDEMAVSYTSTSMEATINIDGRGRLRDGSCRISFDNEFRKIIDPEKPITVTVTPLGNCNGVYLAEVDKNGFTVVENNDGGSNIEFMWIAMARRIDGRDKDQLPREVVSSDYTEKIARGLHNDGDKTTDGEGLYFQNGELIVGIHESKQPNEAEIALKKDFEQNIETRSYEQWKAAFREFGVDDLPITKSDYEMLVKEKRQENTETNSMKNQKATGVHEEKVNPGSNNVRSLPDLESSQNNEKENMQ